MLKELPFTALLEWEVFDEIEPIGGQRGDWQAAAVSAATMNAAVVARSGRMGKFRPRDFALQYGNEAKEV